jgi:hypothetical protein
MKAPQVPLMRHMPARVCRSCEARPPFEADEADGLCAAWIRASDLLAVFYGHSAFTRPAKDQRVPLVTAILMACRSNTNN